MESDTYTIKIELKTGWQDELNKISKIQAAREKPRKIVSALPIGDEIILIYELV